MKTMLDWVRLPSDWIRTDEGLKKFRWSQGLGADATASLMILLIIAHRADQNTGISLMTYDQITSATGLSRAKISNGISLLVEKNLVARIEQRSTFQISNFNPARGWAKIPARGLYNDSGQIPSFFDFNLRKAAELHALKLYLLFAAFRDNRSNKAQIGYDKISAYTGIDRGRIRSALSLLTTHELVYVEYAPTTSGICNLTSFYRLAKLDAYKHNGTLGRRSIS